MSLYSETCWVTGQLEDPRMWLDVAWMTPLIIAIILGVRSLFG